MEGTATSYLLSMGLPGIVIIALAWALFKIYQEKEALHALRHADNEQRHSEMVKIETRSVEAIERSSTSMDNQAAAMAKVVESNNRRARRGDTTS